MAQPIDIGHTITLGVAGRVNGRPARIPGVPNWAAEPAFVQLVPARDGLTCAVTGVTVGDCVILVFAGSLQATYAVSVLPLDATELVIAKVDA